MKQIMDSIKKNITKISIVIVGLIIITGVVIIVRNTFASKEKEMLRDVVIENIVIKDITLETKDGISTYEADVVANAETKVSYITLELKDENDKVVVTLLGYVGKTLKKGDRATIKASTDATITDVVKIDYQLN